MAGGGHNQRLEVLGRSWNIFCESHGKVFRPSVHDLFLVIGHECVDQ
jgi:hypothetical protein